VTGLTAPDEKRLKRSRRRINVPHANHRRFVTLPAKISFKGPKRRKIQMDKYVPDAGPQNWLITPAALAVGETPPRTILD